MCVYVYVCVNQTDYWLVQYQRLMDRKPDSLIDRVCVCMCVYVCVWIKPITGSYSINALWTASLTAS